MHPSSGSPSRAKGLTLGILGVLFLSPDTLIIRLVNTDPWTFIAWRGAFTCAGMLIILLLQYRLAVFAKTYAIGWIGVLIAVIFAFNNIFFQLSVQSTAVANTLVIIATAPLFAALFSIVFLREKIPLRTWVAILLATLGVAIVFIGDLAPGDLFGNSAALVAAIGLGIHFVLVRLATPTDMTPAVAIAGVLMCLIGITITPDLYLRPSQLGYLVLLGVILLPVSFALLTRAPQYLPAPEVSLILLLEMILGPLWVWWAVQERPALPTLIGGGLIVIVLTVHAIIGLRTLSKRSGRPANTPVN